MSQQVFWAAVAVIAVIVAKLYTTAIEIYEIYKAEKEAGR